MRSFSCGRDGSDAGSSGQVARRRAIWLFPVLLAITLVQSGCHESSAARRKAKEERWLKGRAFAELRIHNDRQPLLPGSKIDPELNFETYRQTQARIITSPIVLQGAMRNPDIATGSILKEEPRPLEWLERNLEVTFPAREFIRVSLKAGDPSDVAAIVNAVVNVYLTEVADQEISERRSRITQLERAREDLLKIRRTKTSKYRRLAEEVGATSEVAVRHTELAMAEFYTMLQSELAREQFARARDAMELMLLKSDHVEHPNATESEPAGAGQAAWDEAEVHRLETSLHKRNARINDWKRQLNSQTVSRKATAMHSLELEALQHEIQNDQKMLDLINEEILRLELERDPQQRITLFRRAETPY